MNEEEKEAIEYIKAFQKDLYGASEKNLMAIYIDRVWNYIDKLQKELDNSISKDKICEMIDKRIDYCCTYDEMYTTALEDFKEIIEKGDIE